MKTFNLKLIINIPLSNLMLKMQPNINCLENTFVEFKGKYILSVKK